MNATAVLLAAGAGRKFWPYNEVRNKCAFPIANQPLVLRLARQLREIGFQEIVVVVGAQEGSVRAALRPLGEEGLRFVRQPAGYSGTAPATLAALEAAGATEDGRNALVVYGDVFLSTPDLRATWNLVAEAGATAAALCAPLNGEDSGAWMGAGLRGPRPQGGLTLGGVEGHGRGASHCLAGAYAFSPAAWPVLRAHPGLVTHVPVGGMPPLEADLAETLAMLAEDGQDVAALETVGASADLDKPWHIFDATEAALREMAESLQASGSVIHSTANVSDGAEIEGPICVGPGATIGRRVTLQGPAWIGANSRVINGAIVGKGVVIGENCRVSDYCLVGGGSVLGNECVVGHGGEFEGVALNHAYVYHYSEIYGVLGTCVDIGAATVCGTLRFDDGATTHRVNGRRETPRNGANATYIGDYTRTGVNVITQPGVKIGAYCCIGPGIVLYEDVPSRKLLLLKQEIVERDWGPERYGW